MPPLGSTESLVKAVSPAAGGVEAQRRAFYEGLCVNAVIGSIASWHTPTIASGRVFGLLR